MMLCDGMHARVLCLTALFRIPHGKASSYLVILFLNILLLSHKCHLRVRKAVTRNAEVSFLGDKCSTSLGSHLIYPELAL